MKIADNTSINLDLLKKISIYEEGALYEIHFTFGNGGDGGTDNFIIVYQKGDKDKVFAIKAKIDAYFEAKEHAVLHQERFSNEAKEVQVRLNDAAKTIQARLAEENHE
jgi:hypothetical protein